MYFCNGAKGISYASPNTLMSSLMIMAEDENGRNNSTFKGDNSSDVTVKTNHLRSFSSHNFAIRPLRSYLITSSSNIYITAKITTTNYEAGVVRTNLTVMNTVNDPDSEKTKAEIMSDFKDDSVNPSEGNRQTQTVYITFHPILSPGDSSHYDRIYFGETPDGPTYLNIIWNVSQSTLVVSVSDGDVTAGSTFQNAIVDYNYSEAYIPNVKELETVVFGINHEVSNVTDNVSSLANNVSLVNNKLDQVTSNMTDKFVSR